MSLDGQPASLTFTIVEQFRSTPPSMILSAESDDGSSSLWWAQEVDAVIKGDHGVMPDDAPIEFVVDRVFPDGRHMLITYADPTEAEPSDSYVYFLTSVS